MKLHRLHIENFKAITTRDLTFPDTGVVVVQGRNEVGKTSMIEAFDALISYKDSSRASQVKDAKPVDRDVPIVVEAEFTVSDERVVYRKQWMKQPATTLRFVAGPRAGRTLTGGEAHDAATALWSTSDTTLWKAMRIMQATQLDATGLGGSKVLQRALEAQAGGTPMEDTASEGLVIRVKTEADRYWIASRARPSAEYRAATALAETARDAARAARSALDEVAQTQTELATVLDDLAHLERAHAEQRAECHTLGAKLVAITQASEARAAAELALDRAERECRNDETRHEQRTDLRDQVAEAAAEVERLETAIAAAEREVAPARTLAHEAELAYEQAQESWDLAREADQVAADDRSHVLSLGRLSDLRATLQKLEDLRTRISGLRKSAETALTAEKLDELERVVHAAETAEIALGVGSAHLQVASLEGTGTLLVDGTPTAISDSWESAVVVDTTLEIPGRWRITVSPESATASRADSARDARRAATHLLSELGVDDLSQARSRRLEAESAARTLADVLADRQAILERGDEASVRDDYEHLATPPAAYGAAGGGATPRPAPRGEAHARADEAHARLTEARTALLEASAAVKATRQAFDERSTRLQQLIGELTNQRTTRDERREALQAARAKESDEALDLALASARRAVAVAESATARALEHLRTLDAEGVRAAHSFATETLENLQKRQDALRAKRSELNARLTVMGRDERQAAYDQAETAHVTAERAFESTRRRAEAALLLEQTLTARQRAIRAAYVAPFRARIEELGRATYGDADFRVTVDDDLAVTERRLEGTTLAFNQLSTGAKEQLIILIRLATAMLVDPTEGVPVMLDDALGYSDRQRLRTISRALALAATTAQVILFTCHTDRYAGLPGAQLVEL